MCVFDMQTHDKGIPSIRLRPLRSQDTPQRCMLAANLRAVMQYLLSTVQYDSSSGAPMEHQRP